MTGYDPRTKNLAHTGWKDLSRGIESDHASWEYDQWLTEFEKEQARFEDMHVLTKGVSLINPVVGIALDSIASGFEVAAYRKMEDDIDWSQFKNIDTYEYEEAYDSSLREAEDNVLAELFLHAGSTVALHGAPLPGENVEGWGRFVGI